MRITWFSNAPWSPTGYGTQTAQVVRRLHAAGHEVAVASNYSPLVPELWSWPIHEIPVYPQGKDLYSNDILRSHHEHWTRGNGKSWLITLYDVHVLSGLDDVRVASWVPIDHAPVPPKVWAWFQGTGVLPIAMSKFGRDELRRKDIEARYVPHAIERVFRPTPALSDGTSTRRSIGIPDDAFMVMVNAANQGNIPPRKAWDQMYRGLSVFMAAHEDAYLFLVTDLLNPGGVDLIVLAAALGLPAERVKRVDQYAYRSGSVSQETLAAYYTAADVLLATSMGEGFGLPVIEAQSCGTPVIVTDFSAQPELVGAGWTVPFLPWFDLGQAADMALPMPNWIARRLEESREARGDRGLAQQAIAKAAEYDADAVFEEHWTPVLAEMEQKLAPPSVQRRLARVK